MRFRAKSVNIGCILHLTRVVNAISKLLKKCTLRLTQEKLYFILPDQVANGGIRMWSEIKQENFFDEYNMDGVNKENNEIYLELITENFSRALKCAQSAISLKIKLARKQTPCLTVEIELPSDSSAPRTGTHDIPVEVIPRRLWSDYAEPKLPNFDVTMYLPDLKLLKTVAEKMKSISTYMVFAANQQGDMKMQVETDLVTVATRFQDLGVSQLGDIDSQFISHRRTRPPHVFAKVRIDIRKFLQFLNFQLIKPEKALCNIVDENVIQFYLLHDNLSLQYFIPAVAS